MDIVVLNQGETIIVEPRGRIDSTTSRVFSDRLLEVAGAGAKGLVVDLGQVAYISSAGFRVLLIAAKNCSDRSCGFGLCGLNQDLHRLFEMGAFTDLFAIYPTRDEGIAALL